MESMSPDEIWEFFDSTPGWAALTTMDEDGFPHTVAIGYFRLGEVLYCGCRAGTRKCRNLMTNPKASLMLENGRGGQGLKGVMFQGEGRVIDDPVELLELKGRLADQRGEPRPEKVAPGIAYLELRPHRVRSWKR
ncbi:pyridoxamine 5'-phosphate oxidase family protein [bacterium]|nr:pyridoxamine 5'-phosphate oxidase family protein [bacterium]